MTGIWQVYYIYTQGILNGILRYMQVYYRYNQDIWIVSKLHVYSRHTHVILDGILKVYEMVNDSCMK